MGGCTWSRVHHTGQIRNGPWMEAPHSTLQLVLQDLLQALEHPSSYQWADATVCAASGALHHGQRCTDKLSTAGVGAIVVLVVGKENYTRVVITTIPRCRRTAWPAVSKYYPTWYGDPDYQAAPLCTGGDEL